MAKKKRRGSQNKSELIRQYAAKHPNASATQIAKALAPKGVQVGLVYNVLRKNKPAAKGRKSAKRAVKQRTVIRNGNAAQHDALVAAAKFVSACGGVQQARESLDAVSRVLDVLG